MGGSVDIFVDFAGMAWLSEHVCLFFLLIPVREDSFI